jgi:transcription antitermination factor NusG
MVPFETTEGPVTTDTYWSHVGDAASVAAFIRKEKYKLAERETTRISVETTPENSSLLDFKSFAQEFPERLFYLLSTTQEELRELFIEYYLLEKSQSFLAKAHGQIQTRVWQNLRVIEQAIGSAIILDVNPGPEVIEPILVKAGVNNTEFGTLTNLITMYTQSRSYRLVAKTVRAPLPMIRKLFRPAIETLLASKDLDAVAVGSYLRCLTHHASLTKVGMSRSYLSRMKRLRNLKFTAPARDVSPLLNFGPVASLADTPWYMFEITTDPRQTRWDGAPTDITRMKEIFPAMKAHGLKVFGPKKAAQIFAPLDDRGALAYGYVFARTIGNKTTRGLTHVRGVSEIVGFYDDDGKLLHPTTIAHADVQPMIDAYAAVRAAAPGVGDFVRILTGEAMNYCGSVTKVADDAVSVEINFPTGRRMFVTADVTAVESLSIPADKQTFWGETV